MSSGLPPVIGFSAYSGTGKTTLLKKIIVLLRERDIRLAVIKHAHHDFDIDHPGKDSFELRKSGAVQMLISSSRRKALITELESGQAESTLKQLINDLDHINIDLILVEGFKREPFPKIELHRAALNKPYLFMNDAHIIALATDHPVELPVELNRATAKGLVLLDMNQPESIAEFICKRIFPA